MARADDPKEAAEQAAHRVRLAKQAVHQQDWHEAIRWLEDAATACRDVLYLQDQRRIKNAETKP